MDEVGLFLAVGGLDVGVLAAAQRGHKHLYRGILTGVRIGDVEFFARIVDEHFFACGVLKMHGQTLPAQVFPDMLAELATLKTIRVFSLVFLPEALLCHSFFAEFFDDSRQKGKQDFQPVALQNRGRRPQDQFGQGLVGECIYGIEMHARLLKTPQVRLDRIAGNSGHFAELLAAVTFGMAA